MFINFLKKVCKKSFLKFFQAVTALSIKINKSSAKKYVSASLNCTLCLYDPLKILAYSAKPCLLYNGPWRTIQHVSRLSCQPNGESSVFSSQESLVFILSTPKQWKAECILLESGVEPWTCNEIAHALTIKGPGFFRYIIDTIMGFVYCGRHFAILISFN